MLHLALVQNLLSAVGAAPHLSRPNFPHPASHYPAGVHLALLPFGEQALRHFMFLERPEGMDLHDGDGLAAFGRAAPHMMASDIVPRGQDFKTVGHMYRSIEAGFAHLSAKYGEKWLFVGPPRAQATQEYFGWPELVPVTDLASAQRAIDEILEQGEGPRGHWEDAHFGQFVEILDEFERAREANRGLMPARPVLPVNVRPCDRDVEVPLTDDPVTAKVMDLFNVAYEILLQIFERFFAHTDETDAQLKALADATMSLMFGVIKPLGDLITTLPAGPSYPGVNAGPSFELFYESDYLLPHREAAWVLLAERLDVAAEFCQQLVADQGRDLSAPLAPVGAALAGIVRALSAHLPASDPHVRPAAAPSPSADAAAPADAGSLLRRADDFGRTRRAASLRTDADRGVADVFDRTSELSSVCSARPRRRRPRRRQPRQRQPRQSERCPGRRRGWSTACSGHWPTSCAAPPPLPAPQAPLPPRHRSPAPQPPAGPSPVGPSHVSPSPPRQPHPSRQPRQPHPPQRTRPPTPCSGTRREQRPNCTPACAVPGVRRPNWPKPWPRSRTSPARRPRPRAARPSCGTSRRPCPRVSRPCITARTWSPTCRRSSPTSASRSRRRLRWPCAAAATRRASRSAMARTPTGSPTPRTRTGYRTVATPTTASR